MITPLSDEELKALRSLLVADARRQWAVSAIKGVSLWIAGITGAYLSVRAVLGDLITGFMK